MNVVAKLGPVHVCLFIVSERFVALRDTFYELEKEKKVMRLVLIIS